jgi:hypothetical protein
MIFSTIVPENSNITAPSDGGFPGQTVLLSHGQVNEEGLSNWEN